MTILVQWIHLVAAVAAVGGMAFVLFVLLPSLRVLEEGQRMALAKTVMGRFRWVSWGAIIVLIGSGVYNIRVRAWEAPWGTYWALLTLKIFLALVVFAISLLLTLPIPALESFRARRRMWLSIALGIAVGVILISAFLRGS
jgi:uncharacterized membrane protein